METPLAHTSDRANLEDVLRLRVHSLRATAATNALSNNADIAKVQEWLGYADISTMQMYDKHQ